MDGWAHQKRKLIQAIQACRRQVAGLDDDPTWRAFVGRATGGETSLRAMTGPELGKVLDALHASGAPRTGRAAYATKQARMARGLWIELAELGVVENRSDQALDAFVQRQTGIDAARWLTDPREAGKVIEALKAMRKRSLLHRPAPATEA